MVSRGCSAQTAKNRKIATMADEPAKVVSLEVKRAEPVQGVIEMLRVWLAMAKAGTLRRVAVSGEIYDEEGEDACRYAVAGMSSWDAAGVLEQHAHNLRHAHALETYTTRAEPMKDDDE